MFEFLHRKLRCTYPSLPTSSSLRSLDLERRSRIYINILVALDNPLKNKCDHSSKSRLLNSTNSCANDYYFVQDGSNFWVVLTCEFLDETIKSFNS